MSELLNRPSSAYEPPPVVRREAIIALLADGPSPSDAQPDGVDNDVEVKDDIRPVRWESTVVRTDAASSASV